MTPNEFRTHLLKWNAIARLNGLELSPTEIEEAVSLYGKGYSPDQIVEMMMSDEPRPAPGTH